MRKSQIIAKSDDGRYVIIADDDAKSVSWMTRRDLHEWVWTQPVADISAMLGLRYIGYQCLIYDIQRPPAGYFQRLRGGKQPARAPLSLRRDQNEQVPIADFVLQPSGKHLASVRLPLNTSAQLGPPTAQSLVYPRKPDGPQIAAPAIGCSNQLVRLSNAEYNGPPRTLTLGLLRKIVWRMLDHEISACLGLYGLTTEELAKLTLRNDIGTILPRVNWAKWDPHNPFGRRHGGERKALSASQEVQAVNLMPDIRLEISAEVERDRVHDERARGEKARRSNEAYNRRKERISAARILLPSILRQACNGKKLLEAARSENISNSYLIQAIQKELKIINRPDLLIWRRKLLFHIRGGKELESEDIILLSELIGPAAGTCLE